MKKYLIIAETSIILLVNLLLSFLYPLSKINFTGMLNDNKYPVLIWAFTSSILILHQLNDLVSKLKINKRYSLIFSIITEAFCIIGLLLPYSPENMALSSSLHLVFAGAFFFSITFFFIYILFYYSLIYPKQASKIRSFYLLISFLCGLIYMAYLSINGLFEVVYTSGLACSVCLLELSITEENA